MTDIAPPLVKLEVFKNPVFFTDHFLKNTNLTYATATYDGDQVQVDVDAGDPFGQGQLYCDMPGTSINSAPNRYLVVKVTEFTPVSPGDHYWLGVIKLGSGSVGEQFTTIGLKILDLKTLNSDVDFDFTAFCLDFIGGHSTVTLDYVAVVESVPTDFAVDLDSKVTIHHPLLNQGVPGASFRITNFEGEHTGDIAERDIVLLYVARAEADLELATSKEFGGRVVSIGSSADGYGRNFIDIEAHGYSAELLSPPALLSAIYTTENGRTILEAALALCNDVVAHPIASSWFDNTGSSGSTDDQIDSDHDVAVDEKKSITVFQDILEAAKNPSAVQGFDVHERPSGILCGHLRNSLDFVSPLGTLTPQKYKYNRDIHSVVNKQKVYGASLKSLPTGTDDWCEATTGWTVDYGTLAIDTDKVIGTYSLRLTCTAGIPSVYNAHITRTFSAISCESQFKDSYKKLRFWMKADLVLALINPAFRPVISILAPDTSNYFYRSIPISGSWQEQNFALGKAESDNGAWLSYGSPDWENVQGVTLYAIDNVNTTGIWFDNFHFAESPFSDEDEDPTSQGLYGVRVGEPIVDEKLLSDAECLARAESIIAQKKNPIVSLSDVVADGIHGIWPGQGQHVHGSVDEIDETFRIVEVTKTVQNHQWDLALTLSNEPSLRDTAFLLLQERIKRLEGRS